MSVSTPSGPIRIESEHDATIVVQTISPDSLHAWYEALDIASIGPEGELRPATSAALDQLFVLSVDERGHIGTLQAPTFPESFEGVTDLTAQFDDFFPALVASDLTVGAEWTDSIYAAPSSDDETSVESLTVTRYRVTEEVENDGERVFLIAADAELEIVTEGPVPNQPGLRIRTSMRGPESNLFVVAPDGSLIDRTRSAALSGTMEYIGGPQSMTLEISREYENRIKRMRP